MNRFSVSDKLLKSLHCFFILLDDELKIKTATSDYPNISSLAFKPGKLFTDYFREKYQEKLALAFASAQKEKDCATMVTAPIELEKDITTIKWSICSIWNEDDTLQGFELLGVQLRLSPKESELDGGEVQKSIFENTSQPFFSLDLNGNLIHANTAFADLLSYPKDSLPGTSIFSLATDTDIPALKSFFADALEGKSLEYKFGLLDKTGKKIVVKIINTPRIESGTFVGINAFVKKPLVKLQTEKPVTRDERRAKLILGRLKKILDSSLDMICAFDENGRFTYVSAACKGILGYSPKDFIGKRYHDFVHEEDAESSTNASVNIKNGIGTTNFENRFYRKDGSIAHLVWSSRWEETDKRFYSIARDATEKKSSEANLKASEEKYRILFYNHFVPIYIYDVETLMILEVNDAAIRQYGYSREEFLAMNFKAILADVESERYQRSTTQKDFHEQHHKELWLHKKKNGEIFYAEITSNGIEYLGQQASLVSSIDRTEQTVAEQELRKSNERINFLSQATFDAIWDRDLRTNKITWNDGVCKMFNLSDPAGATKANWWSDNLHPEDKERVEEKINHYLEHLIPRWEDEYRMKAGDTYKYINDRGYIIFNEQNKPVRMIGAMQDLTERKSHEIMLQNLNNSLEKRAGELAESNTELERFAYVASHDLQEPLRMVSSFLQLLEKRYKDKLDNKAHEYINYAVDGAERMKRLILDLLEYSRVNSSKAEVEEVDLNEIIKDLMVTYKNLLHETNGTIKVETMPVINGYRTQILQLFQNLVGNACKYRKSDTPPVIDISYGEEKSFYKFAVADNGIGIDPRFFHKIFIIFQRLHNRDEYSGTGIGLAICKKIVEKHGGKIWVTSKQDEGSTFHFTLPKSN
jgi:PAS domain S-box-containing protein